MRDPEAMGVEVVVMVRWQSSFSVKVLSVLEKLHFSLLCDHTCWSQLRRLSWVADPTLGMGAACLTFPPIPEEHID